MCLNNWLAYGESFVSNHFGDLRIIFYVFLCKINIAGETRSPYGFSFSLFDRRLCFIFLLFLFLVHLVYNSSPYFLRRFVIGISFLAILYREFIQSLVNIAARDPVGSGVVFCYLRLYFWHQFYIKYFCSALHINFCYLRKHVIRDWKWIS